MLAGSALERYLVPLLAGKRAECRRFVRQQLDASEDPYDIYQDLLWPAMERVEKLFRLDRINGAAQSMATRINRTIADQVQLRLPIPTPNGRRVVILTAPGEPEELGAQMTADLFEALGWDVYFVGGGVPNDEILSLIGQLQPEILLIFGTQPSGVPAVRQLIDLIREIGVNPSMNIMVSGGVFNRADGLSQEVNADLFAKTPKQAMTIAERAEPRTPEPPKTGMPKKRRRRRRSAELVPVEAD